MSDTSNRLPHGITHGDLVAHNLSKVSIHGVIAHDLPYATESNFLGEVIYPSDDAYLIRPTLAALTAAVESLKEYDLGLRLWDGYRPVSAQAKMWDRFPDSRYVSNPSVNLGRHCRGTAVDVALIVPSTGKLVGCPTEFDDFSTTAHRASRDTWSEPEQSAQGLLEEVMVESGFEPFPYEWWHFDLKDWQSYPSLDISFSELASGALTTREIVHRP